jgi:hypothetical protein
MKPLRRDRIPVLDMAARFRALGLRFDEVALDRIGHLSPRGHSVASEVLEAEVAARAARNRRDLAGAGPNYE